MFDDEFSHVEVYLDRCDKTDPQCAESDEVNATHIRLFYTDLYVDVDDMDNPLRNSLNTKVNLHLVEDKVIDINMFFSTFQMEREEYSFNYGIEDLQTLGYSINEIVQQQNPRKESDNSIV